LAEAEELTLHALELRGEILGREHPDTLRSMGELGLLEVKQGKLREAESVFRERQTICRRVYGETDWQTLEAGNDLADVLMDRERPAEAVEVLEDGVEAVRQLASATPNLAGSYLGLYGRGLEAMGRPDEAEPVLREARATLEDQLGPDERNHLRVVLETLLRVYRDSGSSQRAQEVNAALDELASGGASQKH
jgi:tetratricopeptide (TPR) repeat protein